MNAHAAICAEFALHWQSAYAAHTDCRYLPALNLWRDAVPHSLLEALIGQDIGAVVHQRFPAGELSGPYVETDCLSVPHQRFNSRFAGQSNLQPRLGRFYPRGTIAGVHGLHPEDMRPFRVVGVDGTLGVDLNSPLAGHELELTTTLLDSRHGEAPGALCRDLGGLLCAAGPGMQGRHGRAATDFWSDAPFERVDASPDSIFYDKPRLVDHVDTTAGAVIRQLYATLLPQGGDVLDLMAGWRSHLPDSTGLSVTGLGMNATELARNPALSERRVQDLNADPVLAFGDGDFDAVVCSLSIEYLSDPRTVFAEVRRVLRPGGRFVIAVSNRWFPPKAINVWPTLHEFERMGLILEVFLADGGFSGLQTWSLRGLPRPDGDRYSGRLPHADPVYAVWGAKSDAVPRIPDA